MRSATPCPQPLGPLNQGAARWVRVYTRGVTQELVGQNWTFLGYHIALGISTITTLTPNHDEWVR